MLYRNILGQAWKTTWQNKHLWFFGIFAALLGTGGEYQYLFGGFGENSDQSFMPGWQRLKETGIFESQALSNLANIAETDPVSLAIVFILGLVILALVGFLIWLAVISEIAIVNNASISFGGKKTDFRTGILAGIKKFWPVLGLNVIIKFLTYASFVIVSLALVTLSENIDSITAGVIYAIAFVVFIILIFSVSFIIKYAVAYLIIKNKSFIESINKAWTLFHRNWLISIEMAFVLFFISLIVSLVYIILSMVIAIPLVFIAIILSKISAVGFALVLIIGLAVYILSLMFVGASLTTFQISSWTALFMQLENRGGVSKIVRVVKEMTE